MRYFFDTEFLDKSGSGSSSIQLISVGIVDENGRGLYLENSTFDWDQEMDPWLQENVRPHLKGVGHDSWQTPQQMKRSITEFVEEDPEFWAYVAAYDWVALISLFGPLIDRPKGWPIFCHDLKQLFHEKNFSKSNLPAQNTTAHFAIDDARWNLEAWHLVRLAGLSNPPRRRKFLSNKAP